MYGLPKDFDGSFFIGREVGHVSFSVEHPRYLIR